MRIYIYMGESTGLEALKMSGPEIVSKVGEKMANVVSGVDFNIEKDSVYKTHLKQFEAIQKAALEKGKKPGFWNEVKAHIDAAGHQAEFMVKDYVYWAMRGGIVGSAFRFVQEHMPITGRAMRKLHESQDFMFKPSNIEKRKIAGLTALRIPGITAGRRVEGAVNWIMGRK